MRDPKAGRKPLFYVALDDPDWEKDRLLVEQLRDHVDGFKVGLGLVAWAGLAPVQWLRSEGIDVFLDLKLHDIPQTVATAAAAAEQLGVRFLTLHALGGEAMLSAARDVCQQTQLLAVTLLTSLDQSDLAPWADETDPAALTFRLAKLALQTGVDGLVCAGTEAARLRRAVGPTPVLAVPGIRLPEQASQDQRRVVTPQQAVAAGADLLVLGRVITQSPRPLETLSAIR
ncbi:MAG: orotidine-5'-phosphate decarboxylase [Firmicutes bacterium]|nr:orotidine-5'-phosphate decarboxylase [Bacillota bacterium]